MLHPPSVGGNGIRAVASEVTARGALYSSDLARVNALLNMAFAGEDDEDALNDRVVDIVNAQPDDSPSSFVAACGEFATLVDEVAARWEKEFQS